ncbi:MAG TPA: fatty acid desaturase [Candidatus Poseidoniales archaeon]|nr:MAG TPA: fatty acid desaturase [Candidatus Poseidoniales archaeon]
MELSTLLWMGALLLVWYLSVGFGVTVAYHRVLTHRSANLSKPLLYALVLAGLPAGPPAEWVGNHRRHHADSDGPNDPHSPVHDGFWYAHCGWYLGIRNRGVCFLYAVGGPLRYVLDMCLRQMSPGGHDARAKDVLEDRVLRFLSTRFGYFLGSLVHILPFVLAYLLMEWDGVLIAWVAGVVFYNAGDAVNSVGHIWGRQDFAGSSEARNNPLVALISLGEGWHSGHHAFPRSARHGLLKGQIDLSYMLLRGLSAVGLASDIHLPTGEDIHGRQRP